MRLPATWILYLHIQTYIHREIIFFITLKNKVCHLWWLVHTQPLYAHRSMYLYLNHTLKRSQPIARVIKRCAKTCRDACQIMHGHTCHIYMVFQEWFLKLDIHAIFTVIQDWRLNLAIYSRMIVKTGHIYLVITFAEVKQDTSYLHENLRTQIQT
jgi:hypothetical protein